MNKYNEVEIQTAKNLLKEGYKWIARENYGSVYAYTDKPHKNHDWNNCIGPCSYQYVCAKDVPIFQSVTCDDKEPTSLESIVHPQILDDAEHRYLSAVIRPFRDRVKYIKKVRSSDMRKEYIAIRFADGDDICLPWFMAETMYKGMEIDKEYYTLEELGL